MAPVVAGAEGQRAGAAQAVVVSQCQFGLVLLGKQVDGAFISAVVGELPGTFRKVLIRFSAAAFKSEVTIRFFRKL